MPLDPNTFFGVPWRTLVTALDGQALTMLDHLASERTITKTLGSALTIRGSVPSFDPQVNIPANDGEAFVGYSDRQMYMFRREGEPGVDSEIWVCRAAGLVMPLQDDGDTDAARSTYTAMDPWQLLYHRPVVRDNQTFPPAGGWIVSNKSADQIVQDLLDNQAIFVSPDPYPEAFLDWGTPESYAGGAFYTGTMESLPPLNSGNDGTGVTFDQATSVGQAFDQLVQGNFCEIVIDPVYDPVNRPGCLGQVSVYQRTGATRNNAIFSWDRPGRSLESISVLYDGGQLDNEILYHAEQGGTQPNIAVDATSVSRYGPYWQQKYFNWAGAQAYADLLAAEQLQLVRNGLRTFTISPMTARAPVPLLEYDIGDSIPVYASNHLRQAVNPVLSSGEWVEIPRIYGMTISLDDNDVERVSQLVLNKDG